MYSNFQNGRVTTNGDIVKDMKMIDNENEVMNNFQVEALYGIQETSKLNQLFFSRKNLDNIQDLIRYTVYEKSDKKYKIGKQSESYSDIENRRVNYGV